MYLWNVNALVAELRDSRLDGAEQFKYLLAVALAILLGSVPVLSGDERATTIDIVKGVGGLTISLFAVYLSHRFNQRGDGRDLILRVVCLVVPVAVRTLAFGVLVTLPIALGEVLLFPGSPEAAVDMTTRPIDVAIALVISLVAGVYLALKVGEVAQPAPE